MIGQEAQPDQRQQRDHERQQRAVHRTQERGGRADAIGRDRERADARQRDSGDVHVLGRNTHARMSNCAGPPEGVL